MHAGAQASNRMAGKQSKSWSKSEEKGKSKESKGKSKGKSKRTKSVNQAAKGFHKGKTSKTGLSGLENSKSETSSETQELGHGCTTDTSWNDGWNGDERKDGWSFDEWNDDWKMKLDTGAAVNTFPLNSGPEGTGGGRFCRTASGKWILDGGGWQLQGYDENGLLRSLNGRLTHWCTQFCAARQKSRAKDEKISTWVTTVAA